MLLTQYTLDAYCERIEPGLLAEPLNAFSNLSFLIAAWAAWKLAKQTGKLTLEIGILIALGAAVGLGSVIWHTYPTYASLILDIAPIVIFIVWYVWLYTRKVIEMPSLYAVVAVVLFLLSTYFAIPFAQVLHGAPIYTPGLIVVLVLGIYHAVKQRTARFALLSTAGVYLTALFFRTIDQEICHLMPIGTHFIWHSLIGLVTYMAMRPLILSFSYEGKSQKETFM
ncbi:MAG: ceramidase domain-containing protein [Acidobacteriota bacterium]|nr:ceramidase domain-containing protein [Acidobacteriota bacterium]